MSSFIVIETMTYNEYQDHEKSSRQLQEASVPRMGSVLALYDTISTKKAASRDQYGLKRGVFISMNIARVENRAPRLHLLKVLLLFVDPSLQDKNIPQTFFCMILLMPVAVIHLSFREAILTIHVLSWAPGERTLLQRSYARRHRINYEVGDN